MADQDQTPEVAETDTEEGQTVTREQFEELKKQLDAITKAQSGSDRKVSELTAELEKARAEKDNTSKTAEERIAALEKETTEAKAAANRERLKGVAREMLIEAKVKASGRNLERLVGTTLDETVELVKVYIEDAEAIRTEANRAHDREHGRSVQVSANAKTLDYAQLEQMSDEEIAQLPPEEIVRITTEAATNRR
jgi:hypothetical protein